MSLKVPPAALGRPKNWRRHLDLPARPGKTGHLVSCGLAAVCGLTWFLACMPYGLWPLAWVGITPLLWVIDRSPTAKRARRWAWVAGIVTMACGFAWVVPLLTRYSSFPWPLAIVALLVYAAYHGLLFYLFALALRRIRDGSRMRLGRPLPFAVLAPLVMAGMETAMPMIFPFQLAITQAGFTPVIQIADLVGATGVTAVLMAVGGAVWDLIVDRDRRRKILIAAGTAAALGVVFIYGWVRMGQIESRRADAPQLAVGLVQANVAFDGAPMADEDYLLEKVEELQDVSADLERRGAELIVWNESAFPYMLERAAVPGPGVLAARHRALGGDDVEPESRFATPLIVGTTTADLDDLDRPPWNSAFMLIDDRFTARYDKSQLVWFSEYIPLADSIPAIADLFPKGSGHFTPGDGPVLFELPRAGGAVPLAPLVCFEDTLPAYVREFAKLHPQLLVNMTNDTWFGDTSEPWQHLALATLRAVEQRMDMVRTVNTGPTGIIDATGRIHTATSVIDPAATPRPAEGHLVHAALLEGGHTVYAAIGDMFGWLCFAVTLLLGFIWHKLPDEGPELPGGGE